jgi:hypothetical protein
MGNMVVLRIRHLADALAGAVMIRHDKAIGRDQARGATQRQSDAGKLRAREPSGVRRPAVFGLHFGGGKVIVGPHALIGVHGGAEEQRGEHEGQGRSVAHSFNFSNLVFL